MLRDTVSRLKRQLAADVQSLAATVQLAVPRLYGDVSAVVAAYAHENLVPVPILFEKSEQFLAVRNGHWWLATSPHWERDLVTRTVQIESTHFSHSVRLPLLSRVMFMGELPEDSLMMVQLDGSHPLTLHCSVVLSSGTPVQSWTTQLSGAFGWVWVACLLQTVADTGERVLELVAYSSTTLVFLDALTGKQLCTWPLPSPSCNLHRADWDRLLLVGQEQVFVFSRRARGIVAQWKHDVASPFDHLVVVVSSTQTVRFLSSLRGAVHSFDLLTGCPLGSVRLRCRSDLTGAKHAWTVPEDGSTAFGVLENGSSRFLCLLS